MGSGSKEWGKPKKGDQTTADKMLSVRSTSRNIVIDGTTKLVDRIIRTETDHKNVACCSCHIMVLNPNVYLMTSIISWRTWSKVSGNKGEANHLEIWTLQIQKRVMAYVGRLTNMGQRNSLLLNLHSRWYWPQCKLDQKQIWPQISLLTQKQAAKKLSKLCSPIKVFYHSHIGNGNKGWGQLKEGDQTKAEKILPSQISIQKLNFDLWR